MLRRFRIITLFAIAVLLSAVVPDLAAACPTCKQALGNDPATAGMIRGYFWSIVFMMSMPFLILGGLSAYFYSEIRRARRQNMLSGTESNGTA